MRILIAEDEAAIAKALAALLERSKYSVDVVYNGSDALDYMLQIPYDALVLDIMMPGMTGIKALKQARARGVTTPALFLTARSEVEDRIAGLDAGADDYLPKPFAAGEFLARVRALTRRSGAYTPDVVSFGSVTLDCRQYSLSSGERKVRLNNKEYQLMELFMRNPHHVFSTENLMDKIWGMDSEAEIDVVWTYISFLRKKLRAITADVELKTIRGAGYSLEELPC